MLELVRYSREIRVESTRAVKRGPSAINRVKEMGPRLGLFQFEKLIHDTAVNHLKVPEEYDMLGSLSKNEFRKSTNSCAKLMQSLRATTPAGQTPSYFCKRDIAEQAYGFPGQLIANVLLSGKPHPEFSSEDVKLVTDLVAGMRYEDSVHDFLDTKP
ncbi:hypothetical protein HOY82DRAFT_542446 [Tuber indicum]|nr:hypothetical protein HOY82DRAFT_542446 [Tuber indicum]